MNHYYESITRKIQEADFVLTVKRGKFYVIKDRDGTHDETISFSELLARLVKHTNKNFRQTLTPILEKIRMYETFE